MHNDREVYSVLNNIIKDALDATAGYVLGVIEYYIMHDVYGSGNIPHVYKRTNEFLNSWMKDIEDNNKYNEVIATIFSNSNLMSYDPETHTHGSYLSGDFREHMAEAIEEGLGYRYFPQIRSDGTKNPAGQPRPFFSDTVSELDRSGKLFSIFAKEMAARGLEINKKNNTIGYSLENEMI